MILLSGMRKMGIDYGKKRVGVAFSDEDGRMAFPHGVIKNDASLLSQIISLINEKKVGEIVIGHSLDKNGVPNEIQQSMNEFITDLTLHTALPVHLQPEQYTTQEALRIQGRTEHTDASAAALILDSFITHAK